MTNKMNEIHMGNILGRLFGRRLHEHMLMLLLLSAVSVGSLFVSNTVSAETYKLNFRDTDIHELIKFVADATNMTIIIDPKIKGKVKVISSKPVNEKELYSLFLSVLNVHGFTAVASGGVVRIVPSKSARSMPVPLVKSGDRKGATSEIVTQVIEVKNVNAAKLIPILRPLVPQQSHMAAYAQSNAIIISDTSANIARIEKIIAQIDKSSLNEIEVVKLKHATASDAVSMLEKLEKAAAKDKNASKAIKMVADKRTNSIILSGQPTSRERMKELIKKIDSPLNTVGNAQVIYLKYAKAVDLAKVLTKVVQNMAKLESEKGDKKGKRTGATIEADEATNAIIVTAEADVMQALNSVIDRLDIPRAQVLVEAIIVEVTNLDDRALGIEWLFANEHDGFGSFSSGSPGSPIGGIAQSVTEDDDFNDRVGALGAALIGAAGGTFGVGRVKEDGTSFTTVIHALENDKNANILSTPSLLTLDNNEAEILVGEEVPFVTGSYSSTGQSGSSNPGNPFQTIERKNVGISLKVTPHINEGDAIILELVQEVSNRTGAAGASDIIINERKIDTTVLTQDGNIVVLGGLMKDEVQESESKVPLLGSIPLLGRLFRHNTTDIVKTNLLVFIRPTIIRDSDRLKEISESKYRYIRGRQLERREDGVNLYRDDVSPLLPAWEDDLQQMDAIKASTNAQDDSGQEAP